MRFMAEFVLMIVLRNYYSGALLDKFYIEIDFNVLMKWGFFKFDKSRLIIFIILSLLYPFTIMYPCIRGEIFSPNSRVCLTAIDHKVFPTILGIPFMFIDYIFYYKYVNPFYIIWSLSSLVPNLIVSFILSYPLNLLYKKFFKKNPVNSNALSIITFLAPLCRFGGFNVL